MSKKLRRRIWRFMDDRMVPAGRFIAGSRPVRWLSRRRSVRVTVGILCLLGALALRYVWRPLKRRVNRIVRFARRREILGWIVAWVMCGWIALAILQQQRFLMGLMLGLVIAGGYAIISLKSPLTGLIMWLVASPFLTIYIAVKPLPGMPVITGDRYCLAVLLVVYLIHLRRSKPAHPNPWLHGMMAVFIIAMLVSALPNRYPKSAAQAVLDTYGAPFLVYIFARRWVSDRRSLAIAMGAMMFVGLYFSLTGIPEHYMSKVLFRPHRAVWVEEALGTMRAQGPAESPSEFGLVVLAAWLLALTGFVHERQTRRRLVYATIVVLAAIAICLTLRRSVYVSAILALICMLAASGRTRRAVAAIAIVGGACLLVFWPQFTSTKVYRARIMEVGPLYTRAVVYATSWEILKDRPLFGVGTRNYPEYSSQYLTGYKDISPFYGRHVRTTHNAYLRIAVDGGLVAFLPYAAILVLMIVSALRAYKRTEEVGLLGRDGIIVFLAFTVALLQDALTDDIFWFSRYLCTLWFFYFGAILGAHLRDEEEVAVAPTERAGDASAIAPGKAIKPRDRYAESPGS